MSALCEAAEGRVDESLHRVTKAQQKCHLTDNMVDFAFVAVTCSIALQL